MRLFPLFDVHGKVSCTGADILKCSHNSILDSKFKFLTHSTCEWRYDVCTSPCFKTCRDPLAETCQSVPK
ncbi:hypothetical protein JD844_021855 [Phrynosoma platyrhinos]|uniref:Otogelin-like/Mucin TIL domain-containing protein n=1 Tax=Phrynosoma platyrhinos TaxID=52577 RepID=A0ABQ7SU85_PHRPL|nr:hypothetical protein JD844_021855 [Phrynosoma platyrhinos]